MLNSIVKSVRRMGWEPAYTVEVENPTAIVEKGIAKDGTEYFLAKMEGLDSPLEWVVVSLGAGTYGYRTREGEMPKIVLQAKIAAQGTKFPTDLSLLADEGFTSGYEHSADADSVRFENEKFNLQHIDFTVKGNCAFIDDSWMVAGQSYDVLEQRVNGFAKLVEGVINGSYRAAAVKAPEKKLTLKLGEKVKKTQGYCQGGR